VKSRLSLASTAAAITMLLLLCAPLVSAQERDRGDGPQVLSNRQVLAGTGRSIAEWGAEWWRWAFDHPEVLADTTGEFGHLGNVGGPVFFALGSGGDPVRASYSVPGGQYILLPVATYIWTFFDPCADVDCARDIVNHNFIEGITNVDVRIDGERVHILRAHLVRINAARPVVFTVDAGPIQPDGYGGLLDAVEGGYWLMLEPLPPGKHHISMFATVPNLDPATGEVQSGHIDLDAQLLLRARTR
jgi:hypothetical protein